MSVPLHQLKRPGLVITVWPNRVQVESGAFLLKKDETFPFRNIASVEVVALTETLVIRTNDGKKHKWNVMGAGGAAKGVRDAILNAL